MFQEHNGPVHFFQNLADVLPVNLVSQNLVSNKFKTANCSKNEVSFSNFQDLTVFALCLYMCLKCNER